MVTAQDSLPGSLATRLTDEQRQAVLEAPRGSRLAALVAALGIDENEALSIVASAAGLDIATNLETDPGARGLLPARLVHHLPIIPIPVRAPPASISPRPSRRTPARAAPCRRASSTTSRSPRSGSAHRRPPRASPSP